MENGQTHASALLQDPKVLGLLEQLWAKYDALGQDLPSYLEGLLYADVLTYWDYIHLDTLLSLQSPRTSFPDEEIFIVYHQTAELYFKLIRSEIGQMAANKDLPAAEFLMRLNRVNRYFEILTTSFDVMVDGMDPAQFMKFRMSLLPASGFQSAQFRFIEIMSTSLWYLVQIDGDSDPNASISEQVDNLYWKRGAMELSTGKKTLTLKMFETRYRDEFIQLAEDYEHCNLLKLYERLNAAGIPDDLQEPITQALRRYDLLVNVNWRFVHFKSAAKYLHKEPDVIAATGGTNWQKYLPPRFQRRMFFPHLWNEEEKNTWGHKYIQEIFTGVKA